MQTTVSNMRSKRYNDNTTLARATLHCTPPRHGIPDDSHSYQDVRQVCMSDNRYSVNVSMYKPDKVDYITVAQDSHTASA